MKIAVTNPKRSFKRVRQKIQKKYLRPQTKNDSHKEDQQPGITKVNYSCMKRWPELPRSLRVRRGILINDARVNRSPALDLVASGDTQIAYRGEDGPSEPVVAFWIDDHCSDPLCKGTAVTRIHGSHFDNQLFYRDGSGPPRMHDPSLEEIPITPIIAKLFLPKE